MHHRRAFTLLELVVVIGVILVLMSLVLAVSTIVIQQAEARQLEATFANLQSAVDEYEQALGRRLTFQDRSETAEDGWVWDVPKDPEFSYAAVEAPYSGSATTGSLCNCNSQSDMHGWEKYIVHLLSIMDRTESASEIIGRIDPNLLVAVKTANGQPLPQGHALSSIVDPWGNAIAVVFPGRRWQEGDSQIRDTDGTIRTYLEKKMGICKNAKVLFVSAGPDGDVGCWQCFDNDTSIRYQALLDNIYSYQPEGQ
jgi:prepilin-type N-terminal cleavage/methylation domain-containing protein